MVFIYLILGIILLIGIILFARSSNSLSVESDVTMSKKITFNKNSWHFWYYSNVFSKEQPKVLCPYYWIMVYLILMSPIILPILGIKKTFHYIGSKFKTDKPKLEKEYNHKKEMKRLKIGEMIGKILSVMLVILLVGLLGYAIVHGISKYGWLTALKKVLIHLLMGLGISASIIVLLTICWYTIKGFRFICLKLYNTNFIQVPKEMVVAIYKKACPIIEWKN
jgi:hypothetical protein